MSADPRQDGQFVRDAFLTPEHGQYAWFCHGLEVDLVRCVGRALIRSPAGDMPAWSVVLDGRVLIVPTDRLTPVPRVDVDPGRRRVG